MFLKHFFHLSKEGYTFIIIGCIVTFIVFAFSWGLGTACLLLTFSIVFFFRDPIRVIPLNDNYILSPADGLVYSIKELPPPALLGMQGRRIRVSIFLSVFDVHVNRIPVDGVIKKLHYSPGKFIRADSQKSEEENERQEILIQAANGSDIVVTQQAGFIARRIVCALEEDQKVKAGERFGIIKFGSRVDVYLPEGILPLVQEGQTLVGGETVLAVFNNPPPSLSFRLD